MSLQPGINPFDEAIAAQMQANIKDRPVGVTGQRMENMGGFDPSDLMARPEIRQQETRNQANMVSAPYEQANKMAAEKNKSNECRISESRESVLNEIYRLVK